MLKRYVFVALMAGFGTAYSMEKEHAKLTYIEDARSLSQEHELYFSVVPKDILGIVQYYRLAELAELKIAQAQDYNHALEYVKALVKGDHPELFDNPTFIDSLLEKISSNFGADPEKAARDINTLGTQLWLRRIRPVQVKLLEAAQKGDRAALQGLIGSEVNVNARSARGNTALMEAARNGHTQVVKELIIAGADVNAQDGHGATALMKAINNGRAELVKILLNVKADVNACDTDGMTALMYAAFDGHAEIVKELIAGALVRRSLGEDGDVNTQDNCGWTALMEAATEGHTEVVNLLIGSGANVDVRNTDGKTALDLARNRNNVEIIDLLGSIKK